MNNGSKSLIKASLSLKLKVIARKLDVFVFNLISSLAIGV